MPKKKKQESKTSYICGVGSVTGCWMALSDLKNIKTNLSKLLTLTTSVLCLSLLSWIVRREQHKL